MPTIVEVQQAIWWRKGREKRPYVRSEHEEHRKQSGRRTSESLEGGHWSAHDVINLQVDDVMRVARVRFMIVLCLGGAEVGERLLPNTVLIIFAALLANSELDNHFTKSSGLHEPDFRSHETSRDGGRRKDPCVLASKTQVKEGHVRLQSHSRGPPRGYHRTEGLITTICRRASRGRRAA